MGFPSAPPAPRPHADSTPLPGLQAGNDFAHDHDKVHLVFLSCLRVLIWIFASSRLLDFGEHEGDVEV
jgi:hypothetical protein